MKLWYLPLEEYDMRYTKQWTPWMKQAFDARKLEYEFILGDQITNTIDTGSVLDAEGTNYYKFTQLANLIRRIKNGDIQNRDAILIADGWYPGIEALSYIKALKHSKTSIWSIFHAGTYDEHDFTYRSGMGKWGHYLERAWITLYDGIFLGSEWHRELVTTKRVGLNLENRAKLHVTGLPFNTKEIQQMVNYNYKTQAKENMVVFPHRLDPEKRPNLFKQMQGYFAKMGRKDVFFATQDNSTDRPIAKLSKEEYYRVLAQSKVMLSFALQETFGYSTLESMVLGVVPIVPDRLSYTDYVPETYRYTAKNGRTDFKHIAGMVRYYLDNPLTAFEKLYLASRASYYDQSIDRMLDIIEAHA